MKRHLIIDGDILAFQAAAGTEVAVEWEPGHWTWHCGEEEVQAKVDDLIGTFMDELEADACTLTLSDTTNFRYSVLPTYKGWRKAVKRPLVLLQTKAWMKEEKGALILPGLEGDDVCGILATDPKFKPGTEKVIVSLDKDLKTIPGLYVRRLNERNPFTGLPIIHEITVQDADEFHMIQTLAGDQTDGYGGCPGIGMERAGEAIRLRQKVVPYEHEFTRGARKGRPRSAIGRNPATTSGRSSSRTIWPLVSTRGRP